MNKKDVLHIFGGTTKLAKMLGVTHAAVSQWPEELPERTQDRIIGAMYRQNITIPIEWREIQKNLKAVENA